MTESFTNAYSSVLAAPITSGATSLTVVSATGAPASGNFRLRIDDEILTVTAVAGTTFAVSRATEAVNGVTAASAHAVASIVTEVLTAASLVSIIVGNTHQAPADFMFAFDGTNYSAIDERTSPPTVPYTSNTSLHNVFNSASAALGTSDSEATGGTMGFVVPSAHVMNTTDPLQAYVQQKIEGPGTALRIVATGSNWSTGTLAAPKAMLDCYNTSRLYVSGLYLDCNNISGTTGILFGKLASGGAGTIGGNDANSYFSRNLIRHWGISGFQIGKSGDAGGTAAVFLEGNQILDDKAADNAMGLAVYTTDVHIGDLNNVRVSNASGYCAYISAGTVLIRGSNHFVNNSATNTNGCVYYDSGADNQLIGCYLDNLKSGPAVRVGATAGAVARLLIQSNRCNGLPTVTDLGSALFVLDATTNNVGSSNIIGNTATGKDATHRIKSIVENIAGGGVDPAASQILTGNTVRYCGAFYTGTRPLGLGPNVIEQPSGTYYAIGGEPISKAGAISDADFYQAYDGQQGIDATNHRLYVRDGGVWKYAALT